MTQVLFKRWLWLFAFPASWLALLGLALAVEKTSWGASGDPSNGFVIFLCGLLSTPAFGLAGFLHAILSKASHSLFAKRIAIVTNISLIVFGIFLWLWWYS